MNINMATFTLTKRPHDDIVKDRPVQGAHAYVVDAATNECIKNYDELIKKLAQV